MQCHPPITSTFKIHCAVGYETWSIPCPILQWHPCGHQCPHPGANCNEWEVVNLSPRQCCNYGNLSIPSISSYCSFWHNHMTWAVVLHSQSQTTIHISHEFSHRTLAFTHISDHHIPMMDQTWRFYRPQSRGDNNLFSFGKNKRSNSLDLFVPRVKSTTYGLHSLRYHGTYLWSFLPTSAKKAKTLADFKTELKSFKGVMCKCKMCRFYKPSGM